ncbi:MAG: alpha/beta hydrolase [Euryarchaeota archaeon]|nr:alpha/beta hydrolase [Euryarchaeota archaeon]
MEEFNIDGLYGRYYPGERGTFILLHGLLSSSGEFFDYPERLNQQGYAVIIFDFSGHGKSKGVVGFESMDKNLNDIKKVLEHFKNKLVPPLIILGHSLGAATTIYALASGIGDMGIAIAPPASIKGEMKAGERIILPVLYGIARVYRKVKKRCFYIKYRAKYETIYVRKDTVEKARALGFLGDRICMDSYPYLMRVDTLSMAKRVDKPCMVITPGNDKLVAPENQKRVYEALAGPKRYYVAQGYNHSVMGEDRGDVIEALLNFVEEYMSSQR